MRHRRQILRLDLVDQGLAPADVIGLAIGQGIRLFPDQQGRRCFIDRRAIIDLDQGHLARQRNKPIRITDGRTNKNVFSGCRKRADEADACSTLRTQAQQLATVEMIRHGWSPFVY